ncbi:DUF1566 domain-containing protein [Xylella fastidiosa]|uniref:DUF1566 domain-containing protein n=1 Tax=Xylella fastidiosa TaxID=2371 RepID=UPI000FFF3FCB|nr:DUF1566 domain-containing protein [Xylella fastidiosa]RWA36801.1 hypothetical protein XfCFBP8078_11205 [Xylella fastidiosa subsp. multiplex]
MSTAPLENAPAPGGARFTKIYDKYGKHIITRDEKTRLEFAAQLIGPFSNDPYGEAEYECSRLTLGGYNDWGLPTREVALSAGPWNGYRYRAKSFHWIWTCTPYIQEPTEKAWAVRFGTTEKIPKRRYLNLHVRAVRGQMRTAATATPKAGES